MSAKADQSTTLNTNDAFMTAGSYERMKSSRNCYKYHNDDDSKDPSESEVSEEELCKAAGWLMSDDEDKVTRQARRDAMAPKEKEKAVSDHRFIKAGRFFGMQYRDGEVEFVLDAQQGAHRRDKTSIGCVKIVGEQQEQGHTFEHKGHDKMASSPAADSPHAETTFVCNETGTTVQRNPVLAPSRGNRQNAATAPPRAKRHRVRPAKTTKRVYCPKCLLRKHNKSQTGSGGRAGNAVHKCKWCRLQQRLTENPDH